MLDSPVLAILGEGLRDVVLPCSAVIWLPGVAVAVAGRGRLAVVAGYVVAAAGVVAARFVVGIEPSAVRWLPAVLGVALLAAVVALRPPRAVARRLADGRTPSDPAVATLGAGLAGAAVALVWRPCVGRELGAAFNLLGDDPAQAGLRLATYVVGLTASAWVAALLVGAAPPGTARRLRTAASGVVGLLGVAVLVGVADDVVATLVRWSL